MSDASVIDHLVWTVHSGFTPQEQLEALRALAKHMHEPKVLKIVKWAAINGNIEMRLEALRMLGQHS